MAKATPKVVADGSRGSRSAPTELITHPTIDPEGGRRKRGEVGWFLVLVVGGCAAVILLIDNYDSFVHNLARYVRLLGCETRVVRSDKIDVAAIGELRPRGLIISPGPKSPAEAGVSVAAVNSFSGEIPILGVCLGHQAIGEAFGGRVITTPPMHGRQSVITHDCRGLFASLPSPMRVGRYHALMVDSATLPECLQVTATADDGTIMAIQHRVHPTYGVQFHPESVLSEHGMTIMANFLGQVHDPASSAPARGNQE
jgi:anthranilate synthase/aminodeoxychorismate synthase-like glutamine amidotransferase